VFLAVGQDKTLSPRQYGTRYQNKRPSDKKTSTLRSSQVITISTLFDHFRPSFIKCLKVWNSVEISLDDFHKTERASPQRFCLVKIVTWKFEITSRLEISTMIEGWKWLSAGPTKCIVNKAFIQYSTYNFCSTLVAVKLAKNERSKVTVVLPTRADAPIRWWYIYRVTDIEIFWQSQIRLGPVFFRSLLSLFLVFRPSVSHLTLFAQNYYPWIDQDRFNKQSVHQCICTISFVYA
jgi:hypothetical protein